MLPERHSCRARNPFPPGGNVWARSRSISTTVPGICIAAKAAEVNAKLSCGLRSPYSFEPILVADLRLKYLDHHEHIERSSLATLKRYRSATNHLANFAGKTPAHDIQPEEFLRHLRKLRVSPNGHLHTAKRALRDKGIQFILETCRSMYKYAARKRHLPPYGENPFDEVRIPKSKILDRQAVEVLDAETELQFFKSIELPLLPFFILLAKTGARSGELRHALIEDFDLQNGWWHVRNKPALGWWIKTRRERSIPLMPEAVLILRKVIGTRPHGVVFWHKFRHGQPQHAQNDYRALVQAATRQVQALEQKLKQSLSRDQEARVFEKVWREAGIVRQESVRIAMMRTTARINRPQLTCPKSWRHTFACLLQEANVDPLIRQITLGHMPVAAETSALGMIGVYGNSRLVSRSINWRVLMCP